MNKKKQKNLGLSDATDPRFLLLHPQESSLPSALGRAEPEGALRTPCVNHAAATLNPTPRNNRLQRITGRCIERIMNMK